MAAKDKGAQVLTEKKHFYVLIRTDLPLSQQIVQSIHAAYESAVLFNDNTFQTHSTVLCQVNSEKELIKAAYKLELAGIKHHIFKEPDIGNQHTALCTEPLNQDRRKLFSNWKLWKED